MNAKTGFFFTFCCHFLQYLVNCQLKLIIAIISQFIKFLPRIDLFIYLFVDLELKFNPKRITTNVVYM